MSDVEVPREERVQLLLRLHIAHLLQVCSRHTADHDAGVPARGLNGEAYRGHVFWDELYVYPFLNFRVPEITRALLRYRYRRLGEARVAARELGYRGAMYPWQSGSDGKEETQVVHLNPSSGHWEPDRSHNQRHVNAAIFYNVWQYLQATDDLEFIRDNGAEMMLEIARFWASIAHLNPDRDRYEIHGVMGPDEYHEKYPGVDGGGLRNNAYTNVMVAWIAQNGGSMGTGVGWAGTFADGQTVDSTLEASAVACASEGEGLANSAGLVARSQIAEQSCKSIARAILDVAADVDADADVVVLGSRGRGGVKSFLLGSVSHDVSQHADRAVLVVPSPAVAERRGRWAHHADEAVATT